MSQDSILQLTILLATGLTSLLTDSCELWEPFPLFDYSVFNDLIKESVYRQESMLQYVFYINYVTLFNLF